MAKSSIGFANWPFPKGEKAKLIKISKPYAEDGKWYVKAEYLSSVTNKAGFIKHFFGDLHLLIVGAGYMDGMRQDMPNWKTTDIQLSAKWLSNKQYKPYLIKDKQKNEFDYYTFGIGFNNQYYIVPLAEIVRAILAPDVFCLNQVTLLDSIDTCILYDYDGEVLNLNFSTDVPVRYVKIDSAIKHLAWLFSNPKIYNMIEQLYQNIRDGEGILFDFLFEELTITAKFEEWNGRNYVREIVACKRKRINCNDIIVNHPGLVEYKEDEGNGATKTRNIKRKNAIDLGEGKQLVSNLAATTNTIDIEDDNLIISEYSTFAKIKRIKVSQRPGKTAREIGSDDIRGTNKRTTSDFGGLETVPQMEFANMTTDKLEGDFADILEILQLMEKRIEVVKIEYYIGTLNDHLRYRAICTLDDGKTPRKYLIGKIKLHNGYEAVLIEIQRESLTLSTLVCLSHDLQKWNRVCHKILKGLIEKSGVWPDLKEIGLDALVNYRFRHTNVEIIRKEKRIFEKIFVNHI